MMFYCLLAVFALAAGQSSMDKFLMTGIVPDVLDKAPRRMAEIYYGNKSVSLGNELKPSDVQNAPTWFDFGANSKTYYTVILTDPDAPSRASPTLRSWLHWLVINVRGCDFSTGRVLQEYGGSWPPADGGIHRYVFTVYEQPRYLYHRTAVPQESFSLRRFARIHCLGNPIAGNFFFSRYEKEFQGDE